MARDAAGAVGASAAARIPSVAIGLLLAAVALKLALHITAAVITPYELQRDEFLYLAMGEHLHLWRMDFPPAIAILSELMRATVGVGLVAIRLVPAAFSVLLVILAALSARELGGRRYAQGLAALAVIASAAFLRVGSLFQPVVLDQLAWTLVLFALIKLSRTGDARWWIAVGVAGGFGLLAKLSIGIIAVGVLVALLALPERRWLAVRWPWIAALLALLIGSPTLVGQIRTGWPAIIYARELGAQQLVHVTVGDFFASQLQMLGPSVLLALAGLWEVLRRPQFRVVAVACVAALAILLVLHGKGYYFLPVYPVLFGAGAAWAERITAYLAHRSGMVAARAVIVVPIVGYGAFALPFGLPVLQPEAMARYATLGSARNVTTNTDKLLRLPQDYADMLHWRERVAALARAYDSLPPDERARTVIAAGNYGEAGAIDYYGPALRLPGAICASGSYWFFGPGALPGEVLLTIGINESDLRKFYESVQQVGHLVDPWAVPEEQELPIYVAKEPRITLQQLWPRLDPRTQAIGDR